MPTPRNEIAEPIVFETPISSWLGGLLHAVLFAFIYGIVVLAILGVVLVAYGWIKNSTGYVSWACVMMFAFFVWLYFFRHRLIRRISLHENNVMFHSFLRSASVSCDETQLIRIIDDDRVKQGYSRIIIEGKWGGMHQIVLQEDEASECFYLLLDLCPSAAAIDIDDSIVIPADGIDRMAAERRLAGFYARRAKLLFAAFILGIPCTIFFIYFAVTNRSFTFTNLKLMTLAITAPVATIAAGMVLA